MSTTPRVNAIQTPTYNGARNAREIDNFLWKFEDYFGAVGIVDEAQKTLLLFGGAEGATMSTEDPLPSPLGMDSRGSSKSNSTPRTQ